MPSFEYAFIRQVLHLVDQWPQLKEELARCGSSKEAGTMVAAFLQQQAVPKKQELLEQTLALALRAIKPELLGREVGIAYRHLFAEPTRDTQDDEEEEEEEREEDGLSDWRGNSSCALLVQLRAELHEPHGGLAWSDDLPRRGYPTVIDWRKIDALQVGRDYEFASLSNTMLEQVVNFGDVIHNNEMKHNTARPHRALAGLLLPLLGRTATHAVLFRIAQAGLLDRLVPDLYPLGESEKERQLAYQAQVCDAKASQLIGIPSAWHRYYINHLALASLLADVVGVELASTCMQALEAVGTIAGFDPRDVGLPNGGEENEWQWCCEEGLEVPEEEKKSEGSPRSSEQ